MTTNLRVPFATAAILGLFSVVPASADTIGIAEVEGACGTLDGSYSLCDTGFVLVSSSGGDLDKKTLNSWTGMGVEGGLVDAEIDGTETVTIGFDQATYVDSTELIFLYEPGAFGDQEYPGGEGSGDDETAMIQGYLGGALLYEVVVNVTSTTTATTTAGTISNLSVADSSGGGAWLLSSPFAGLVDSIVFLSGDPGVNSTYSDFSLGSTTYTRVPEPTTLSLLMVGCGVVGLVRRKRKKLIVSTV